MDTYKPTLKRGRNVWDQVNMPAAEYQDRIEKIQDQMEKESMDVLFLYALSPDEYAYPCYVSNYYVGMGGVMVAIPRQGKVTLFFSGSARGIQYERVMTPVEDIRPGGEVVREAAKYLKDHNLKQATVGLAGFKDVMPYVQLQSLRDNLKDCKLVDAEPMMNGFRLVKSLNESNEVRRAARIVNHTFSYLANTDFKDLREYIVEPALDREARMEGAEDVRLLIGKTSEKNWALRPAEDLLFSTGERVVIYLSAEYERYWAEGIRTFVVQPPRLVPVKSDVGDKLFAQIMGKLTPGKKISQAYKAIISELDKSGVKYTTKYGLGAGIGLNMQEMPSIAPDDASTLKAGMCLTLRLAFNDPVVGDMVIGNTIYLSKEGPEILK